MPGGRRNPGSRPGARREAFETYVKRLESLEKIASSYRGVDKGFRDPGGPRDPVMVKPEDVDDARCSRSRSEIAKRVETELQYPGQIRITVVREVRSVEYAK